MFYIKAVLVGFVVDKVVLGQIFRRLFVFFFVNCFPTSVAY